MRLYRFTHRLRIYRAMGMSAVSATKTAWRKSHRDFATQNTAWLREIAAHARLSAHTGSEAG